LSKPIDLDYFIKKARDKTRSIDKGLLCPICGMPLILMGDVCRCPNECFEWTYEVSVMKDLIRVAKIHKKGIYREKDTEERCKQ
jgi:hypothetical protein